MVVLGEGSPPNMMYAEAKQDHLEGVSLLSASLAPGGQYVPAKVEVTQVGLGDAGDLKYSNMQLFANSLNIVTLFEPASVITGVLALQDVKG